VAHCCNCGEYYSLPLSVLKVGQHARGEMDFEHEGIEIVIDTNLKKTHIGGIQYIIVEIDIDQAFQEKENKYFFTFNTLYERLSTSIAP
jgi:hypothetical protein